jgi:transposase-like protein
MIKALKTIQEKEAIIAEYLMGGISFRRLGDKHGVDFRILHSWVSKFQGKTMQRKNPSTKKVQPEQNEHLTSDVQVLQHELRKSKLQVKLLNAIIDIAEDQLKIDIRKKSGTKR